MTNHLRPDKAVQFKMELGSEVAGQFMNEHAKQMLVPLALLSECVKKVFQATGSRLFHLEVRSSFGGRSKQARVRHMTSVVIASPFSANLQTRLFAWAHQLMVVLCQ